MHEHLDVPYHQQDTNNYCGAACAQMVLHGIGQPLLSQDDLYNDNHNHTVEAAAWASPPDGLCWTLNNRQPQKHFTLDSTVTEEPVSRTLCWAIHRYQCAPVAPVYAGNHWVVVRGYTASEAPGASFDTSYTISSFDLNNPWPPVPAPPGPPPRADGDACGSGGNRGAADINVSYSTWQRDYLAPNAFGTQWLGRYVAVCDPDPPSRRRLISRVAGDIASVLVPDHAPWRGPSELAHPRQQEQRRTLDQHIDRQRDRECTGKA